MPDAPSRLPASVENATNRPSPEISENSESLSGLPPPSGVLTRLVTGWKGSRRSVQ